jgi:tetratricopeptide (TPR) repeat protein
MRVSFVILIILAIGMMVNACAPIREVSTPPPLSFPPPVTPSTGGEGNAPKEDSPRRMASLHLTEKGKGELEQGELKKAMDRFEKAIGLDAGNGAAYYYFAEARFRQNEFQQSLTLLNRAEALVAGDSGWLIRVYLLQGKNYDAEGYRGEAIKRYQKVLAINPDNPEAIKRLK